MKSVRKGNDIGIAWAIKSGDAPFSLEGKDIAFYLSTPYGKVEIKDYTISGNVITWTFYGKDQSYLGNYSLVLVINEDVTGMVTTDYCDFVRLVSRSCEASGEDDGVQTEVIELTSEVSVVYDDAELRRLIANLEEEKADKSELTELSSEVSGLSESKADKTYVDNSITSAIYNVLNSEA